MTFRVRLCGHLKQGTWLAVAEHSGRLLHDLRGIHIKVSFSCCLPRPLGYHGDSPGAVAYDKHLLAQVSHSVSN